MGGMLGKRGSGESFGIPDNSGCEAKYGSLDNCGAALYGEPRRDWRLVGEGCPRLLALGEPR
jgi:hypothetical protein